MDEGKGDTILHQWSAFNFALQSMDPTRCMVCIAKISSNNEREWVSNSIYMTFNTIRGMLLLDYHSSSDHGYQAFDGILRCKMHVGAPHRILNLP